MRRSRPLAVGLVLLWAVLASGLALARDAALDKAVLAGDWTKVAAILGKDDAKARDPVARLLMGHASLALNRGNDAFLLFRSVTAPEDIAAWKAWADGLARAQPENPTALYLAADATARKGDLQAAIDGFTSALRRDAGHKLSLNARGVALAVEGDADAALTALIQATRLAPDLADAHASYGTFIVLQAWSYDDAGLRAFDRALQLDPRFALALNGRGCFSFGSGKFEEAVADFRRAAEILPELVVAGKNQSEASAHFIETILLPYVDSKPGTTLTARVDRHEETLKAVQTRKGSGDDPQFIAKINAFEHLASAEQEAMFRTYGKETVGRALMQRMQANSIKLVRTNSELQQVQSRLPAMVGPLVALAYAEKAFSISGSVAGAADKLATAGWRKFRGPAEKLAAKTAASAALDLPSIPTDLNPVTLGLGAASNIARTAKITVDDRFYAGVSKVERLHNDAISLSRENRNLRAVFDRHFFADEVKQPLRSPFEPQLPRRREEDIVRLAGFSSGPPPNGVSSKEIARAFVDRGFWPVLTSFSLNYAALSDAH